MPTSSAVDAARRESAIWTNVAERWHPDRNREIWDDLPGAERAVIPEVDPLSDLRRRADRWSYPLTRGDLADVSLFAAALARTEQESWSSDDGVVATQAYEERRRLAGDRILPWAVPWLRAVARWFPEHRVDATATTEQLLEWGDRNRPAAALTATEGLFLPGHDGYGPVGVDHSLEYRVGSLWGGLVVFRRSLESILGQELSNRQFDPAWSESPEFLATLVTLYEVTSVRWDRLADRHLGTARYWLDVANRAQATAESAKELIEESAT